MKKILILASFLALAPFAKGQLLLEALEGGQNEKCLERVKDKYYGDGVHNFIYCAVMGPGNKKWLNLNLGAEYAREGSEYFNPEAVPGNNHDWRAFGSLYNYNRDSDGHEIVQYRRGTDRWEVMHENGYRETKLSPGEKSDVVSEAMLDSTTRSWDISNDPCPNGYRVLNTALLTGSVGYTMEGEVGAPSILRLNDYPNWNLVLAPAWGGGVIPSFFVDSNKDWRTTVSDANRRTKLEGYTAGIWITDSRPGDMYHNNSWFDGSICDYMPGSCVDGGKWLDRGVLEQKVGGNMIAMMGVNSAGFYVTGGVRCVEK